MGILAGLSSCVWEISS